MTNFIIDIEATGRTPMSGLMTEFGIVEVESGDSFYAHLYNTLPIPEGEPFIPQIELDKELKPIKNIHVKISNTKENFSKHEFKTFSEVVRMLAKWVNKYDGHPVAISDNNGFDMMWLNCFLDEHGDEETGMIFGHSSRRIGDFYAGTTQNWQNTNKWKKWRKTKHDHNPVNDAKGNREALLKIWDKTQEQKA